MENLETFIVTRKEFRKIHILMIDYKAPYKYNHPTCINHL